MQVFEFPLQITHSYMRTTLHGTLKSDRLFSDEVFFVIKKFFTWVKFLSHSCGWFFFFFSPFVVIAMIHIVSYRTNKKSIWSSSWLWKKVQWFPEGWEMSRLLSVSWARNADVWPSVAVGCRAYHVGCRAYHLGCRADSLNGYCFCVKLNLVRMRFSPVVDVFLANDGGKSVIYRDRTETA